MSELGARLIKAAESAEYQSKIAPQDRAVRYLETASLFREAALEIKRLERMILGGKP